MEIGLLNTGTSYSKREAQRGGGVDLIFFNSMVDKHHSPSMEISFHDISGQTAECLSN